MTVYPTLEEVIEAHRKLIELFGGTAGIRDRNALESALLRPQTGYYTDTIEEASALWESLSQNHPFVDGNKRVAITVTAAFLAVNGYTLQFEDADAFRFLVSLYETGTLQRVELDGGAALAGEANRNQIELTSN